MQKPSNLHAMESGLTLQELQAFHTIDRTIYTRLLINVGFDHSRSKQVIAFWIWLERDGFSHFVYNLLALPDSSLYLLAREAIGCLFLLQEGLGPPLITTVDKYIPLMRQLLSKDFSFTSLYEKRQSAISSIEGIIQNVCEIAFCDMVEPNLTDIARQYCFQPQESAFCPQYSSHYVLTVLPRDRAFLLSAYMDQEELEDLIARYVVDLMHACMHAAILITFVG